jgi:hypothetical protein
MILLPFDLFQLDDSEPQKSSIKVIMDFWLKTPLLAKTQKIIFCKYLSIQ